MEFRPIGTPDLLGNAPTEQMSSTAVWNPTPSRNPGSYRDDKLCTIFSAIIFISFEGEEK